MSTKPHSDDAVAQTPPESEAAEETAVQGVQDDGGELIPAFGKEALISIALFVAFVLFVIICLPTYIL